MNKKIKSILLQEIYLFHAKLFYHAKLVFNRKKLGIYNSYASPLNNSTSKRNHQKILYENVA